MMRSLLLAFMLSGSVFALSANAFAQTSPNTTETDQSEEDWRKSQKKGGNSTEDILDIIKNTRSSGIGNGRGASPIDSLPEESRRHLMKERARRMAQAGPNEPVDVSYKPSEGAKSDSELEADEKAAWEELSKGLNGTTHQGQQGQGQQGQGQQGGSSGSQGQQGQQQGGGQSDGASDQSGQSQSVMRGGSAASVSEIMARIKGLSPAIGSAGQGQGQQGSQGQGQSQSGQPQSGQSGQGQAQQAGQASQGQSQQRQSQQGQTPSEQSQSQSQSQSQQDAQQESSQSQAQSQAKSQAEAASQAHSIAHGQDAPQSRNSERTPEATSPLDRIKELKREQSTSGTRSSASDFLKKQE